VIFEDDTVSVVELSLVEVVAVSDLACCPGGVLCVVDPSLLEEATASN
jgi:hypothetical protein